VRRIPVLRRRRPGLIEALPPILPLSAAADDPLHDVIALLSRELAASAPGQQTVLDRLLDVLLVPPPVRDNERYIGRTGLVPRSVSRPRAPGRRRYTGPDTGPGLRRR
jgi:hypothetical protein